MQCNTRETRTEIEALLANKVWSQKVEIFSLPCSSEAKQVFFKYNKPICITLQIGPKWRTVKTCKYYYS